MTVSSAERDFLNNREEINDLPLQLSAKRKSSFSFAANWNIVAVTRTYVKDETWNHRYTFRETWNDPQKIWIGSKIVRHVHIIL